MTATTALTAQNTQGVRAINSVAPEFVREQINAVFDDMGVDVVKIGMLSSNETVEIVTSCLRRYGSPPVVLDPVMVATSGAQLLPDEAVSSLCEKLLPITTILTPNLPEAKLLLKHAGHTVPDIRSINELLAIAAQIQALGPKYVLLKGGHVPLTRDGRISQQDADNHVVLNVLCGEGETTLLETDYVASRNTHGTGCSLAYILLTKMYLQAAIATQMVINRVGDMTQHVQSACRYVEMGIQTSVEAKLGQGNGPINHFHNANGQASLRTRCLVEHK